ncbi:hypothetical protein DUNSADRAFT_7627 [Dunaliella salina]|uniref:Encoded protein n=1 Tax=Dunaliella salina TaxID=3046 RepID=A0ABQ7GKY0_DUNSA|nr:hypothetical protein DUNSADRAFT_7627 [Dunaliella salina]|eukprot:KAF5835266.1 hypothetical protein DUNSADRAFT_7627 [Dunaliella salina]
MLVPIIFKAIVSGWHPEGVSSKVLSRWAVNLCKLQQTRRENRTITRATMGGTDASAGQLRPALHSARSGISVTSLNCGGNILEAPWSGGGG